jgi:hypothetical protein
MHMQQLRLAQPTVESERMTAQLMQASKRPYMLKINLQDFKTILQLGVPAYFRGRSQNSAEEGRDIDHTE